MIPSDCHPFAYRVVDRPLKTRERLVLEMVVATIQDIHVLDDWQNAKVIPDMDARLRAQSNAVL